MEAMQFTLYCDYYVLLFKYKGISKELGKSGRFFEFKFQILK